MLYWLILLAIRVCTRDGEGCSYRLRGCVNKKEREAHSKIGIITSFWHRHWECILRWLRIRKRNQRMFQLSPAVFTSTVAILSHDPTLRAKHLESGTTLSHPANFPQRYGKRLSLFDGRRWIDKNIFLSCVLTEICLWGSYSSEHLLLLPLSDLTPHKVLAKHGRNLDRG